MMKSKPCTRAKSHEPQVKRPLHTHHALDKRLLCNGCAIDDQCFSNFVRCVRLANNMRSKREEDPYVQMNGYRSYEDAMIIYKSYPDTIGLITTD